MWDFLINSKANIYDGILFHWHEKFSLYYQSLLGKDWTKINPASFLSGSMINSAGFLSTVKWYLEGI